MQKIKFSRYFRRVDDIFLCLVSDVCRRRRDEKMHFSRPIRLCSPNTPKRDFDGKEEPKSFADEKLFPFEKRQDCVSSIIYMGSRL